MRAGSAGRVAFAMAALVSASLAHADFKDSYARGLKAYRDGNLAEARMLFQQALGEHPEAAAKIRLYGQVYEPYLPQHYLGLIAFKDGDCAGALAQWNSAPNRAILGELSDVAAEQQRDGATCSQKLAATKKEEKPPEPLAQKPAEPVSKPVVKNTPPPANRPPVPIDRPVAEKPPIEKSPVVLKNEPPQPLIQAFDDYLAGRYAEVARINPDAYADSRARFHAYLVRAAAKFTLAKAGGDEQLLAGARSDAKSAHVLDATTSPDATLFSPAFRTFYQESR